MSAAIINRNDLKLIWITLYTPKNIQEGGTSMIFWKSWILSHPTGAELGNNHQLVTGCLIHCKYIRHNIVIYSSVFKTGFKDIQIVHTEPWTFSIQSKKIHICQLWWRGKMNIQMIKGKLNWWSKFTFLSLAVTIVIY